MFLSALICKEKFFSTCRFSKVTTTAPKIAPRMLPMPPTITMAKMKIDWMKLKLSG